MTTVPLIALGDRTLRLSVPGEMQHAALAQAIVEARLGDVSLEGLSLEAAAERLAEHVELRGESVAMLATVFVDERDPEPTPEGAERMRHFLSSLSHEADLFVLRGALALMMLGLLRAPAGLAMIGVLRECDNLMDRLGGNGKEPRQ